MKLVFYMWVDVHRVLGTKVGPGTQDPGTVVRQDLGHGTQDMGTPRPQGPEFENQDLGACR